MTWRREYIAWASLKTHQRKVEQARECLIDAASRGSIIISTSWGKDSVALCDLAIETLGRVPLFHLKSAYQLPGNEKIVEHFAARTEVFEVPARMSLDEIVAWLQTHGLDYERQKLRSAGTKRKTDAAVDWVLGAGYRVQALGMRAQESRSRATCFRIRGLTYQAHGLTVTNPLGWWSARDVWAHLASRDLPYHPLYDCETHGETRERLRNAGWLTLSPYGADAKIVWLREHYPDQYRDLVKHFPQVARF